MKLKDCTKAELLWIIDRMQCYSPFHLESALARALDDAELERELKRFDEADRINHLSAQARQRALELLAPYDGKPMVDIPPEIVKQAGAAIEEARALDRKWNRLMGFKEPKEAKGWKS